MARNFNMVSPAVHRSKRWVPLETDPRLLGLYLLTSGHQNSAGCCRILPGYACADLGGWSLERYADALAVLESAEIVVTDQDSSEILILRWFKHCPPTNSKHYLGTLRIANAIESERLRALAVQALNAAWEAAQAAKASRVTADVVPMSRELRNKIQPNR